MSNDFTPEAILQRIETPEDCEQFAINVREKFPEVASQATRRAIQLRAQKFGATSDIEREALEVVYAYETVLSARNQKKTRASREWQMIKKYGILPTVERSIGREMDTPGYKALCEMGMKDLTFEGMIQRHPTAFSANAVASSAKRLAEYEQA